MGTYVVNFTNINTTPIEVLEQTVDDTSTDISLFGLIRLKYGEALQENLLHLLENFACPEDPNNKNTPDLIKAVNNILENPVDGQLWYNSTTNVLHQWDGLFWVPLRGAEDTGANWGSLGHGQLLPRPISPTTGYEFPYEECVWSIAPATQSSLAEAINCSTSNNSEVTMLIQYAGTDYLVPGQVNYLIVGLRGNKNRGNLQAPPPIDGVTPTPSPTIGAITPTPSVTPTIQFTPTVTPTVTPTQSPAPTITPTVSADPLGELTRLYVSPSFGDPGAAGPGGVAYSLANSCGPNITRDQVEQTYSVSLQNLSGGIPPYTVDFRWLYVPYGVEGEMFFTGAFDPDDPDLVGGPLQPMSIQITYAGGYDPPTNFIRTGLNSSSLAVAKFKPVFDSPDLGFDPTFTYLFNYYITGKVTLYDSVGQSKSWWIPDIAPDSEGSNITDNPGDLVIKHYVEWQHYELCYHCPDCTLF